MPSHEALVTAHTFAPLYPLYSYVHVFALFLIRLKFPLLIATISITPLLKVLLSTWLEVPFPLETTFDANDGIVGGTITGILGAVGAVTVVGSNPVGVAGALTVIFLSPGVVGVVTVGAVTVILSTAPGVVTDTFTPLGAVGTATTGAVTVGIVGIVGLTVPGNAPRFTVGADTLTDTLGLIIGSSGSIGFILAPTSIVSLNTSLSTATPFPDIILSFPTFPVALNRLLPLFVP